LNFYSFEFKKKIIIFKDNPVNKNSFTSFGRIPKIEKPDGSSTANRHDSNSMMLLSVNTKIPKSDELEKEFIDNHSTRFNSDAENNRFFFLIFLIL
jgi:hypothetical protein